MDTFELIEKCLECSEFSEYEEGKGRHPDNCGKWLCNNCGCPYENVVYYKITPDDIPDISDDIIEVVKVTLEGEENGYFDDDIDTALLGLKYEMENEPEDRSAYTIRFVRMTRKEFESLPEFTGF